MTQKDKILKRIDREHHRTGKRPDHIRVSRSVMLELRKEFDQSCQFAVIERYSVDPILLYGVMVTT